MCERTAEQLKLHQNLVEQTIDDMGVTLNTEQLKEFEEACRKILKKEVKYDHLQNMLMSKHALSLILQK